MDYRLFYCYFWNKFCFADLFYNFSIKISKVTLFLWLYYIFNKDNVNFVILYDLYYDYFDLVYAIFFVHRKSCKIIPIYHFNIIYKIPMCLKLFHYSCLRNFPYQNISLMSSDEKIFFYLQNTCRNRVYLLGYIQREYAGIIF